MKIPKKLNVHTEKCSEAFHSEEYTWISGGWRSEIRLMLEFSSVSTLTRWRSEIRLKFEFSSVSKPTYPHRLILKTVHLLEKSIISKNIPYEIPPKSSSSLRATGSSLSSTESWLFLCVPTQVNMNHGNANWTKLIHHRGRTDTSKLSQ